MRISHYNTFADGGSAVLMVRLHEALRSSGHDSRIRYRKGNLQLPGVQRLEYCHGWLDRPCERIRQRSESWAMVPNAPSYYGRYCRPAATPRRRGAPDGANRLQPRQNSGAIHAGVVECFKNMTKIVSGWQTNNHYLPLGAVQKCMEIPLTLSGY